MCHDDLPSSNNVWMSTQKDVCSNVNYVNVTSEFSQEHDFFNRDSEKKVPPSVDFSSNHLLNAMSYSAEKTIYMRKVPQSSSGEAILSEDVAPTDLPTEEMLLQSSKDYLNSCKLLDEFEEVNHQRILDERNVESTNTVEVKMPLISNSPQTSVIQKSDLQTDLSSLVTLMDPAVPQECNTLGQNCSLFHRDCNALEVNCNLIGPQCDDLGHVCNILQRNCCSGGSDCNSPGLECSGQTLHTECSLIASDCNSLAECNALDENCTPAGSSLATIKEECHTLNPEQKVCSPEHSLQQGNPPCSRCINSLQCHRKSVQKKCFNQDSKKVLVSFRNTIDHCSLIHLEQACKVLSQECQANEENFISQASLLKLECNAMDLDFQTTEQGCRTVVQESQTKECQVIEKGIGICEAGGHLGLRHDSHERSTNTDNLECSVFEEDNRVCLQVTSDVDPLCMHSSDSESNVLSEEVNYLVEDNAPLIENSEAKRNKFICCDEDNISLNKVSDICYQNFVDQDGLKGESLDNTDRAGVTLLQDTDARNKENVPHSKDTNRQDDEAVFLNQGSSPSQNSLKKGSVDTIGKRFRRNKISGSVRNTAEQHIIAHVNMDMSVVLNSDKFEESVTTVEGDKLFDNDPPGDLLNTVSIVYSAFEEESTTFSKLWNSDIEIVNDPYKSENLPTEKHLIASFNEFDGVSLKKHKGMKFADKSRVSSNSKTQRILDEQAASKHVSAPKSPVLKIGQFSSPEALPTIEDVQVSDVPLEVSKYLGSSTTSIPSQLESPSEEYAITIPMKVKKTRESLWEARTPKVGSYLLFSFTPYLLHKRLMKNVSSLTVNL